MLLRSWLAAVALALTGLSPAAIPAAAESAVESPTLWRLTDLAAQRVQIADKVAAAKFGTTAPIDDPVREQAIYDSVSVQAPALGLDPAETVRFFRAQIEANKVVQRGLYARWAAHPSEAPTTRPDLATEVRPVIDRLNKELLNELAATHSARGARWCSLQLLVATRLVDATRYLDPLHSRALDQAVQPTCD